MSKLASYSRTTIRTTRWRCAWTSRVRRSATSAASSRVSIGSNSKGPGTGPLTPTATRAFAVGGIEGKAGGATTVCSSTSPMDDSTTTSYRRTAQAERGPSGSTRLDDHGQPPKALYAPRAAKRLVSERLGLCKGMICDGEVTEGEVAALKRWLAGHPDAARLYPGKTVAERLLRILCGWRHHS